MVSVALLVALVVLRVPWYCGLAMFIPVDALGVRVLASRRNTCVMRAKEGTFENDDFSTVKAPDDEVAASRVVAVDDQPRRGSPGRWAAWRSPRSATVLCSAPPL